MQKTTRIEKIYKPTKPIKTPIEHLMHPLNLILSVCSTPQFKVCRGSKRRVETCLGIINGLTKIKRLKIFKHHNSKIHKGDFRCRFLRNQSLIGIKDIFGQTK